MINSISVLLVFLRTPLEVTPCQVDFLGQLSQFIVQLIVVSLQFVILAFESEYTVTLLVVGAVLGRT